MNRENQEGAEEDLEEDLEDEEPPPEPPAPLDHPMPAPRPLPRAKSSLTLSSAPNINQEILDLVAKKIQMQAEVFQQVAERQEEMYRHHQQDREGMHGLMTDLGALRELWMENLGAINQKLEQMDEQIAALVRLNLELQELKEPPNP